MKRLILALGIGASALAISTPASAQTGCRWYDVNCRLATGDVRRTGGTIDSSWHIIGRDANGNEIYERRRVDGNGNVVVERARRDALGRMIIIDRDINNSINRNNRNVGNSSRRYEKNGMLCTYKENSQGYKEHCKYAKNNRNRLYRINDVYRNDDYRDGVYRNDDYRDGVYRNRVNRANTVRGDKYNTARANNVYGRTVSGSKYKVGKANSAKHNKSNGKGKGHNKH
jgi:hypothetical protein